jgi:hypothetical protein
MIPTLAETISATSQMIPATSQIISADAEMFPPRVKMSPTRGKLAFSASKVAPGDENQAATRPETIHLDGLREKLPCWRFLTISRRVSGVSERQRRSGPQPRVAELPWGREPKCPANPVGVAAGHGGAVMQPFQGWENPGTNTQGSRCAPTLGWRMERRGRRTVLRSSNQISSESEF